MRLLWLGVLLAAAFATAQSSAAAQSQSAAEAARDACGEPAATFAVKTESASPADAPAAGTAQVYIVEVQDRYGFCVDCAITLKVGLDGKWAGATKGTSMLSFHVQPGVHHLCAAWQSRRGSLRKHLELSGLTAEAGKTYFFRAHVTPETPETLPQLRFEAVDPDEGKLLLASAPKSDWTRK